MRIGVETWRGLRKHHLSEEMAGAFLSFRC
jgi:hypothetical protein